METYQEFLHNIRANKHYQNYYAHILHHREQILLDVAYSTQSKVAKKLNISPAKFSPIVQLLKQYDAPLTQAEHMKDGK